MALNRYEAKLLAQYAANMFEAWKKESRNGYMRAIMSFVEENQDLFGMHYTIPDYEDTPQSKKNKKTGKKNQNEKFSRKDIAALKTYIDKAVKKFERARPSPDYVFTQKLLTQLGFNETDRQIVELLRLAFRDVFDIVQNCLETMRKSLTGLELAPVILGLDKAVVFKHLSINSPLQKSGLVYQLLRHADGDDNDAAIPFYIHYKIDDAINAGNYDVDNVINNFIGKAAVPESTWDDFKHIHRDASFAAALIKEAVEKNTEGVNIIIYGETGTGKTEFCKVLAAHLGLPLYAVGEKDGDEADEDEPSKINGMARIADMRLAQSILTGRKTPAILLFDEMEDLLSAQTISTSSNRHNHSAPTTSKVLLHRLIEKNVVPVLYTTNNPDRYEESLLRRFSFAIELKTPTTNVRASILKQITIQHGLEIDSDAVHRIASAHQVAPAFFNTAARSTQIAGRGEEGLALVLRNMGQLIDAQGEVDSHKPQKNYDLSLLNPDANLEALARQIIAKKNFNFSLGLYGVPGAGKTEYPVYLAHALGLDIMKVRYSDIGDKYVGEAEKKIKLVFEQAADEGRFLIFDEADSLLTDRRLLTQSWERTAVNEMLAQIERHKHPMACSTNLMEDIDQAALRRFTFKVKFGYMKHEQAARSFKLFSGFDLPTGRSLPSNLTPGDFANVSKQSEFMQYDAASYYDAIVRESKAKKGATRPIGFTRTPIQTTVLETV